MQTFPSITGRKIRFALAGCGRISKNHIEALKKKMENGERWMELDLEYVNDWSLWLDFKILLMTFVICVSGRNAY